MNHWATPAFWHAYQALRLAIQRRADRNFELLKPDLRHPSLHFKSVGRFWSARVDRSRRALAVRDSEDCIWFRIGSHADYDRLIG